jgi:hypothetical protein
LGFAFFSGGLLHKKDHLVQEIPTTFPLSKKLSNFRMIAPAQRRR